MKFYTCDNDSDTSLPQPLRRQQRPPPDPLCSRHSDPETCSDCPCTCRPLKVRRPVPSRDLKFEDPLIKVTDSTPLKNDFHYCWKNTSPFSSQKIYQLQPCCCDRPTIADLNEIPPPPVPHEAWYGFHGRNRTPCACNTWHNIEFVRDVEPLGAQKIDSNESILRLLCKPPPKPDWPDPDNFMNMHVLFTDTSDSDSDQPAPKKIRDVSPLERGEPSSPSYNDLPCQLCCSRAS